MEITESRIYSQFAFLDRVNFLKRKDRFCDREYVIKKKYFTDIKKVLDEKAEVKSYFLKNKKGPKKFTEEYNSLLETFLYLKMKLPINSIFDIWFQEKACKDILYSNPKFKKLLLNFRIKDFNNLSEEDFNTVYLLWYFSQNFNLFKTSLIKHNILKMADNINEKETLQEVFLEFFKLIRNELGFIFNKKAYRLFYNHLKKQLKELDWIDGLEVLINAVPLKYNEYNIKHIINCAYPLKNRVSSRPAIISEREFVYFIFNEIDKKEDFYKIIIEAITIMFFTQASFSKFSNIRIYQDIIKLKLINIVEGTNTTINIADFPDDLIVNIINNIKHLARTKYNKESFLTKFADKLFDNLLKTAALENRNIIGRIKVIDDEGNIRANNNNDEQNTV